MDALDRELAQALAVDPSPEFVARLRARIAAEPAPSTWRMPRVLMAAGAAAVLILAVLVVTPRPRETEVVQAFRPAVPEVAVPEVVQAFMPAAAPAPPVRHHRPGPPPAPIQLVSIADMPSAPMGAVVPAMTFDDVVTMTGVHQ